MNRLKKDKHAKDEPQDEEEDDLVMELPPGVDPPGKKKRAKGELPTDLGMAPTTTGTSKEVRLLEENMRKSTGEQEKLSTLVQINRSAIDEVKNDISEINVNIKDLLAIYEYVSQQFNPFFDGEASEAGEAGDTGKAVGATKTAETTVSEDMPFSSMLAPGHDGGVTETEIGHHTLEEMTPMLASIPHDHISNVLMLRWIEFLLQRVRREHILPLFDFYTEVNWISDEVKTKMITFVRGGVPDVTSYEPDDEEGFPDLTVPAGETKTHHYTPKVVDEWRLSADDHLKSYLFIQRILGETIDKNKLNKVEMEIRQIKGNLKSYYGL